MAQVSGQGTIWNLVNYFGDLFTADQIATPFLTMIGGLTGGAQTPNFEFPTSSEYDFPAEAQPAITETDSLTAPAATAAVPGQVKNVTQIFQRAVSLSYSKLSNAGRLTGINTVGSQNNMNDALAFNIDYNLKIIARDVEESFLNGAYAISTASNVANKTRGMMAAAALSGGTVVAAAAAALSKPLLQQLFREMFLAGAKFENVVLWTNALQKQRITDIYAYAPEDRNVGGVNIKQIETDFGNIGVAPAHRFMDTDSIGAFEMSVIKPVTQPVPEKGNMFYEVLAKTGASDNGQLYGQIGLDHGPAFAHGVITGLAL